MIVHVVTYEPSDKHYLSCPYKSTVLGVYASQASANQRVKLHRQANDASIYQYEIYEEILEN